MKKYYIFMMIAWMGGSCSQIEKYTSSSAADYPKIDIIQPEQWKFYEQRKPFQVVVIVDVFRACTTAAYLLDRKPQTYILASKSSVIQTLATNFQNPLCIGKAEQGVTFTYAIPNSPTRVEEVTVTGKPVLHRTAAGASGILMAKHADKILAAGFVNATATANYIKTLLNAQVILIPMGHEGVNPTLEDNLCAEYIKARIHGEKLPLTRFILTLKKGAGQYFFSKDQWQYPREDFFRCLEIDRFDFIIQATIMDDYAILTRGHALP